MYPNYSLINVWMYILQWKSAKGHHCVLSCISGPFIIAVIKFPIILPHGFHVQYVWGGEAMTASRTIAAGMWHGLSDALKSREEWWILVLGSFSLFLFQSWTWTNKILLLAFNVIFFLLKLFWKVHHRHIWIHNFDGHSKSYEVDKNYQAL